MVLDKDYEVLGRLGEGSFGKVYKAQHKHTGDEVAVKQIKLGSRSWDEAVGSMELQALKSLRHPFIVRLRELIRSQYDGSLYYIFEFIDSDLCRLVKANPNGLEEPRAAELARQLFAGLSHMHLHNFFHRDLKPENILLQTERETIRIADLGQARSLRARPPFTDYVGTRWYRAPECLLRDRGYSSPVDIWASGLICAELLRGSPVFCGTSTVDQLYKIFTVLGQPLTDWPDFARLAQAIRFRVPDRVGCGIGRVLPRSSPQAQVFLTEVLTINPRRRPVAKKVLEHQFFAQLPPLDIEQRLDTHRSRASERVSDEHDADTSLSGAGGDDPPPSSRDEPEAPASTDPEIPGDIDDLDAELDKILGTRSSEDLSAPSPEHSSPDRTEDASPLAWSPINVASTPLHAVSNPLQPPGFRRAQSVPPAFPEATQVGPEGSAEALERRRAASVDRRRSREGETYFQVPPSMSGAPFVREEGEATVYASLISGGAASSAAPVPTARATGSENVPPHGCPSRCSSPPPMICSFANAATPTPMAPRLRRPWAAEEAGQLRRVVRRAIRRRAACGGRRDADALWLEVSAEVGGSRGPRECKLQYNRDCRRSHQGWIPGSCRLDWADDHYRDSCFFFMQRASSCTRANEASFGGEAWRQHELLPPASRAAAPEPLCFAAAAAGLVV